MDYPVCVFRIRRCVWCDFHLLLDFLWGIFTFLLNDLTNSRVLFGEKARDGK